MIEEAQKGLHDYLLIHSQFLNAFQRVLKDKQFSLEERWDMFLKGRELLPVETYSGDAISVLTDSPYDDLYVERYQYIDYADIEQRVIENFDEEGCSENVQFMLSMLPEFRESVLQAGYKGCIYDW